MSCLPDSSTTLEQPSSTCKNFYNYKLFAFLSQTLYTSSLQIDEANSPLLFYRVCMPSSCSICFETTFISSDIPSKVGTSLWLGMP